jgi:hypothetical protein
MSLAVSSLSMGLISRTLIRLSIVLGLTESATETVSMGKNANVNQQQPLCATVNAQLP